MKTRLVLLLVTVTGLSSMFLFAKKTQPTDRTNTHNASNVETSTVSNLNTAVSVSANENVSGITNTMKPKPTVVVPVSGFFDRSTKKPFGMYITPQDSPVQPEKFTGYHTGVDAETTPDEQTVDVPVYAIADGTVVLAGHVNGYGGVMMIRSVAANETITALYGYLRIASFTFKNGDHVNIGDQIAVLGTGFSSETDGERKHLHFGILKGASTNVRGYVQSQTELNAWYDPVAWLQQHGAT